MSETKEESRSAIIICSCSGSCPSMAGIDFWTLAERVRLEMGDSVEFLALHPRLCEEDGERLMHRLVSSDVRIITPACAEKRQEKLLREGFAGTGVTMDSEHWIPLSMAQETTESVLDKIRAALGVESPAS